MRSLRTAWLCLLLAACAGSPGSGSSGDEDVGEVTGEDAVVAPDVADVVEPPDVPAVPDAEPDVDVPDVETPDSDAADGDVEEPDIFVPPEEPDYVTCDAGHEAWVKRTLPVLLGRRAHGMHEVRVLAQMAAQTSREEVARGLMESPEFLDRWALWFMDEVRVNRVGDKTHGTCYGGLTQADDDGTIARFVRDNPADTADSAGVTFNMTDLLYSSLKIDDITPFYRAHLFAMMAKPLTGANVDALELDITRRQDFGEAFEAMYLHRNVVCAGCHNSEWSTTDHPDPDLDRHWPVQGKFERAIYGAPGGIAEMEVYSIFRHLGVVRTSGGRRPWKMVSECGRFTSREQILNDPGDVSAHFVSPLGLTASVWDVEDALRQGVASLRESGAVTVDPDTLEVDGPEAFAYLLSMRIVNQVWREVMGYPLTLVHYFPRNADQHDLLMELTERFVLEQWSLKTLLTEIVTHPLYNDPAPVAGCGQDAYQLPPVFNPWITEEAEALLHENSPGDVLHRHSARVMLRMLNAAMDWPAAPLFPGSGEESFQKAIGVFVKDAEPGFRGVDFQGMLTWENRYGACAAQGSAGGGGGTCAGFCGGEAQGCYCDGECEQFGDCCDDYQAICVDGEPPPTGEADDWIGRLAVKAASTPETTVRDALATLKDRLLTEPDIDDAEEAALLAALLGAESLDQPVGSVASLDAGLRRVCGVLVSTPQFLLTGLAAPDQSTTPPVVVDGRTFKSQCESWAPLILQPKDWTFSCEVDTIDIAPYLPPLGL